VAAGRVWTGQLAQEKGLVDELGGLEAAIQSAAKLAAIEDDEYTVSYWPKPQTLSEQIFNGWKDRVENKTTLRMLQSNFPALQSMQELINMTGIQARSPYTIEIE
jgi:protease-4